MGGDRVAVSSDRGSSSSDDPSVAADREVRLRSEVRVMDSSEEGFICRAVGGLDAAVLLLWCMLPIWNAEDDAMVQDVIRMVAFIVIWLCVVSYGIG